MQANLGRHKHSVCSRKDFHVEPSERSTALPACCSEPCKSCVVLPAYGAVREQIRVVLSCRVRGNLQQEETTQGHIARKWQSKDSSVT